MGESDPHFPRVLEAKPHFPHIIKIFFPHFFKILTFLTFSLSLSQKLTHVR